MKLNVLLALTDTLRVKYKNMVSNYTSFFITSQGMFLGVRDTYTPKEGLVDEPSKRKFTKVATTVNEKFSYFVQESQEFIDALFSQEKTNASGIATAKLIVEKKDWGTFTSLELLRLKSLLESGDLGNLESMLSQIPVRSDSIIWEKTDAEEYKDRDIFETNMTSGVTKTTVKEEYVLPDPNVASGKISSYSPQVSQKNTVLELGDYTHQQFSGEWSQREKANALRRRNILLIAVVKALKESNECDVVKSELTASKIFEYILSE